MGVCFTQRRLAEGSTLAKFAIFLALLVRADVTAVTLLAVHFPLVVKAEFVFLRADAFVDNGLLFCLDVRTGVDATR